MVNFAFIGIQLLSLIVMLIFVHEYKRISHKHENLVHTIEPGVKPSCTLQSTIIIWLYVICILIVAISSSIIFFLTPALT
ncbi:MAG: hypothetical protein HOG89_00305 [Candidatus Peribacter sp.]|jgi:hypothetical protein|nr:hypothetical protein [Candidatus Peribacter sp.]MBT4392727.1 hypothetical protein [Candidatus Peribacter sp.]MBT4600656.1 hypothetical protein [Candidatus Peribacter sp.]MBT5148675.1 hypothetical protein [Candidatus Peribacter sp.]MBT5637730.1 hypothetical protein [Candidatus Peribacter sp.]